MKELLQSILLKSESEIDLEEAKELLKKIEEIDEVISKPNFEQIIDEISDLQGEFTGKILQIVKEEELPCGLIWEMIISSFTEFKKQIVDKHEK